MIDISHLMTDEIIQRHRKYIIDCNIESKLKKLSNGGENFPKEEIEKYVRVHKKCTAHELEKSFSNFIEYLETEHLGILKQTKENECHKLRTNNLFTAEPKYLNQFINKIDSDFKLAIDFVTYISQIEENEANKTSVATKSLLSTFGYEAFTSSYIQKIDFVEEVEWLRIKNNLKTLKDETGNQSHKRASVIRGTKERLDPYVQAGSFYEKSAKNILDRIEDFEQTNPSTLDDIYSGISKAAQDENLSKYKEWDIQIAYYKHINPNNKGWGAYDYLMTLGINTCPYCNRQYISPVYSESNGKVRADLDHFFSKAKYPYLSMSLFNLVPSCKFCNSSLKGTEEFKYDNYIHPFEGGFKALKFYLDISASKINHALAYEVKLKENTGIDVKQIKKEKNNAKIFKLEPLYNYHNYHVENMVQKRFAYSEKQLEDLIVNLEKLCLKKITRTEALELILAIPEDEMLYEKVALSKFQRDIAEDLGFYKNSDAFELSDEDVVELLKRI